MATYIVTTSNWNNPAFWEAISEAGPGHTLDFSALPSSFDVNFWPDGDLITVSNATSTFSIGDSDASGPTDATMGGATRLQYFTTVIGSQGSGIIDGSAGNDTIFGEAGEDTLNGQLGNDVLVGGDGNDDLTGGAGNDTLFGEDGDDTLTGGAGNDQLYGGLGDDVMSGGSGDDLFQGQEGNDTIFGGTGSDEIMVSSFADVDRIDGGESAGDTDELVFVSATPVLVTFTSLETGSYAYQGGGGASGTFTNIEHFEGGSGNDTLDLSNLPDAVTVTFTGGNAGTITNGTDTITFSNIESLILTDDADVVEASLDKAGMNIDMGAGDDRFFGGIGDDTVEGGAGDDRLLGGGGNDSLSGGTGVNLLDGGSGGDTIDGTNGGYDILTYQGSTSGVTVDLTDTNTETGGDAQSDTIFGVEQIDGSNFNDSITLDDSGMEAQGRDGDDLLVGGLATIAWLGVRTMTRFLAAVVTTGCVAKRVMISCPAMRATIA